MDFWHFGAKRVCFFFSSTLKKKAKVRGGRAHKGNKSALDDSRNYRRNVSAAAAAAAAPERLSAAADSFGRFRECDAAAANKQQSAWRRGEQHLALWSFSRQSEGGADGPGGR